ncbi:hypothetical protein [Metabacillus iocasae]|uniref:Uncharacterized protein n=1 Tax=Priestia iocasae TaxID=2291674 RepID=A0ABS2QY42_9BACI|nr:hypothetical protein [Metabacillus iocasae]MBM7703897.1 hypothetical protein [Metabacillus iocasae]
MKNPDFIGNIVDTYRFISNEELHIAIDSLQDLIKHLLQGKTVFFFIEEGYGMMKYESGTPYCTMIDILSGRVEMYEHKKIEGIYGLYDLLQGSLFLIDGWDSSSVLH